MASLPSYLYCVLRKQSTHQYVKGIVKWLFSLSCLILADLIQPQMIKGFGEDLKWHFTKLPGAKGIFDANIAAFDINQTLVCCLTQ